LDRALSESKRGVEAHRNADADHSSLETIIRDLGIEAIVMTTQSANLSSILVTTPEGLRNNLSALCRGLTWTVKEKREVLVLLGADDRSDPYAGDTLCEVELPLLCLHVTGA
jgi:hypothetical protein